MNEQTRELGAVHESGLDAPGGSATSSSILAEDGPLIIAADDLQWLDAASAQPMEFALRRLEDEPIGMLATARTEERPARSTDFVRTIGEGRAERIRLEPLSLGATHRAARIPAEPPPVAILKVLAKISSGREPGQLRRASDLWASDVDEASVVRVGL